MRTPIAVILLAAAALWAAAPPQRKKAAPPPKTEDSFVTGKPFTLEQIQRAVELVGKKRIPEARLKQAIQNRGLDFSLPSGEIERLKAAGAPDSLAELIESSARPVPKRVEPPRPKAGALVATCAPAECDVSLNGKPFGKTANGVLKVGALPEGRLVVDFKREGYVGAQSLVTIADGKSASAAVTLEPDRSTREAWGKQVFQKMVQALGGEAGVQSSGFFASTGSLTVPGSDGKAVKFALVARLKVNEKGLFQLNSGNIKHQFAFSGSQYAGNKSLKGPAQTDVETDLKLLREHMPLTLLAKLSAPGVRFIADGVAPKGSEEMVFRAETGTENWVVTLTKEFRPQQATLDSTGPNSGLQIFYLDYVEKEKGWLPQGVVVRRPGPPERKAEFRFENVTVNPKLKDSDFVFKKNLFK
jgi:hypothetical protein